ncbi:SNF2 family N-terminal domain-containing protein [Roridomyces roridus]|uniref:SNF2 family N-terminal domain-containing protein n=1 Tax=Roridomyces roridus TaxID=1738132 RepID=A0AAD7CJD6_9AGAR|nr:SNF2 family N-terminal domain-containing protein [Roridomyces roridus]
MHTLFASVEAPVFALDYEGRETPVIYVSTPQKNLIGILNSWHNHQKIYPWLKTPSDLTFSCVVARSVESTQDYDENGAITLPPELYIKIVISGPSERKSFYCSRMLWAVRMDPHRALYEAQRSPQGPPPTWQIDCQFDRASVKACVVMDSTHRFNTVDAYTATTAPELPCFNGEIPHLIIRLYRHQLQAVEWMIKQEDSSPPCPGKPKHLWEQGPNALFRHRFYKILNLSTQDRCSLSGGGLLADSMGLGKTLSTLALISATLKDVPRGFVRTTLIIVPLSVIDVWRKEIDTQCPGLKKVVYYPPDGSATPRFEDYDIVSTNYDTLAGEKGEPLLRIPWRRIVIDECHNLRNSDTALYKKAMQLRADSRWGLSGTPIINKLDDLRSLVALLRLCPPLGDIDFWKKAIANLKEMMNCICLRRTKDMVDQDGKRIVQLPDVTEKAIIVTLYPEQQALYNHTEAEKGSREWTSDMNHVQILKIITRLRQIAIHPSLIPEKQAKEEPKQKQGAKNKASKCKGCSQVVDQEQGGYRCLANKKPHVFCSFTCLPGDREVGDADLDDPEFSVLCPCGAALVENDTFVVADHATKPGVSAKLDILMKLCHAVPNGEKSLVFSNFVQFLKIAQRRFANEGIQCALYHGGMSARDRTRVIDQFRGSGTSGPRVMLISIHAGGVGLNLTAANHVFLIDPWWQSAIEHQAIDRVNRIGQEREVEVIRLVAQNTIEARIREIQVEKAAMIQRARYF